MRCISLDSMIEISIIIQKDKRALHQADNMRAKLATWRLPGGMWVSRRPWPFTSLRKNPHSVHWAFQTNKGLKKKKERRIHEPVAENWEFFGPCGNSDVALDLVNRTVIEGLTAEGMSAWGKHGRDGQSRWWNIVGGKCFWSTFAHDFFVIQRYKDVVQTRAMGSRTIDFRGVPLRHISSVSFFSSEWCLIPQRNKYVRWCMPI